ncbi:MAG: flagellar hook-length control protein FliK [Burkholderiales bacterium]|nr:flagellar hook-length control protein FliK [Burkholderiales bacterium]
MTPLDALARIVLLSQSLERTFSAAPEAKLPQVSVGQQVSATVEERLPNGNFRVSIDNQPLQMSLPQGTKAGDTIDLVLISREPRLTFRLDLPQQASPALSTTGRLIAQLLPDASKPNPPLTQANPILETPPSDPAQLAQSLKSALSQSGLFYESHQAQWVMGERPLSQLQQEPQNRAMATQNGALQEHTQGDALPRTVLHTVLAPPAPQSSPAPTLQQIIPPADEASPKAAAASSVTDMASQVSPRQDILPIVRQQIETLESREFNWSGQVWPGQNMDWQVREEGQRQSSEQPDTWQSRLRLVLPMMGEVEANLRLTPSGVQISLQAANQETGSRLRESGKMLLQSLEAGGIPVVSMTVKQHG